MTAVTQNVIKDLLVHANAFTGKFAVTPGDLGGNNRIDIVVSGDKKFVVKWYFQGTAGERDRLASEWAFLQFAHEMEIEEVPVTYATHLQGGAALYEFVPGRKLGSDEINSDRVVQAAQFLADLNAQGVNPRAQTLGQAAEAYWTLEGHIQNIANRMARLTVATEVVDSSSDIFCLIADLTRTYNELKCYLEVHARRLYSDELPHHLRIVSPSDFGFHNVLLRENDTICFIDFEYAGWDDPAKAIADFFLQPALPVSFEYFDLFVDTFMKNGELKHELRPRIASMLPVLALKWCCIMLNPFVPAWAARNQFANHSLDLEKLKSERLSLAIEMHERCKKFMFDFKTNLGS